MIPENLFAIATIRISFLVLIIVQFF